MLCIKRRENKYVKHNIIRAKPNYKAIALNNYFNYIYHLIIKHNFILYIYIYLI